MEAEVRPSTTLIAHDPNQRQPSLDAVFQGLSRYPFSADSEFQTGLASILGPSKTTIIESEVAQRDETVLQAQCFYFARKYNLPLIDHMAYQSWLRTRSAPRHQSSTTPNATAAPFGPQHPPQIQVQAAPPSQAKFPPEPPYPNSFAHIVDLITRNQPIPGIEEIPDTILEAGSSPPNKTPQRKKPWEKDEQGETEQDDSGDVVRMLQPTVASEMPDMATRAENYRGLVHAVGLKAEDAVMYAKGG